MFSYGTVETDKGLAVQSPSGAMGELTGFAALTKNVPQPFNKEFSGGPGMQMHDKFVVVDFNGANQTVFAGSSNLAAGGEQDDGDSLVMIEDASIATRQRAIEAVAMFDHYHFNKAMQSATKVQPLALVPGQGGRRGAVVAAVLRQSRIQMRDRYLFAGLPLPAGMAATKTVGWKALDAAGIGREVSFRKSASKKSASGKPAASKAPARKAKKTRKTAAGKTTRAKPAKKQSVKKKKTAAPKKGAANRTKKRKSRT